ncbi:hypothetical protein [Acidovorax sp. LjRoot194]|uniref:hypothetical protein n=1 Tax=Acidovorax sp. LjRoot194 TaxID=3342280 RepID=UPI003ED1096B
MSAISHAALRRWMLNPKKASLHTLLHRFILSFHGCRNAKHPHSAGVFQPTIRGNKNSWVVQSPLTE